MLENLEEKFFENAGYRIKRLALWYFVIEAIVAAIGTVVLFVSLLNAFDVFGGLFLLTPVAFFVALGIAWLAALPLYGFGELLEKAFAIEKNTRITTKEQMANSMSENSSSSPINYSNHRASLFTDGEENDGWRCPECDTLNSKSRHTCQGCMKPRSMQSHKTVPMSNVIICSSCGLKNNAGVKKCWNCGARL